MNWYTTKQELISKFFQSLNKQDRGEWLTHREACTKSLYFLIKEVGGYVQKAGGDSSEIIHKPICDFWQDRSIRRKGVFMPRYWFKCVHPDTLIQMADGSEKRIADIKMGDSIVGYDGFQQVFSKVLNKQNTEANLYKITFRSGREIMASDEHPFLQIDGSYKSLPKYGAIPRGLKTLPSSGISEDEAALIGYFVAEGCMSSGNMSFTNGIPEVQADFEALVSKRGWGHRRTIGQGCLEYHLHGGVNKGKHGGTPRSWAREHGLSGKTAHEKTLPDAIMAAGQKAIKRIIGVLFATDGSLGIYSGIPQITYCSVNKTLCLQVQNLLNRFHVFSSIIFTPNKYRGAYHLKVNGGNSMFRFTETFRVIGKEGLVDRIKKECYLDSWFTAENLLPNEVKKLITERCLRKSGIRVDNKYRLSRNKARRIPSISSIADAEVNWDDVISSEHIGIRPTVDIETSSGNYVANGLITHNTTDLTEWGNIWEYLNDNEIRILIPTEKAETGNKWLRGFMGQQVLRNERLRWLYPELQVIDHSYTKSNTWSGQQILLPRQGIYPEATFTVVGIRGASQGGHFDIISPDDLVGEKGMESSLVLEDAMRWFDNVEELLASPFVDAPDASTVRLAGTHWAEGDYGRYIQKEYPQYQWRIVPCRKDDTLYDNTRPHVVYLNNPDVQNGDSNWPEKFPTEHYEQMASNPSKQMVYWSQHMNVPRGNPMNKIDIKWFKYFHLEERNGVQYILCEDDKEMIALSDVVMHGMIDPGGFSETKLLKTGARNAVLIGGQPINSVKKFVIHTWAGRPKQTEVFADEVFTAHKKFKVRAWRIETIGAQEYIKRDLREKAQKKGINLPLISMPKENRKDEKDDDIQSVGTIIQNGEVYIMNWMHTLKDEIAAYPAPGVPRDLADMLGKLNKYVWSRGKKVDLNRLNQVRYDYLENRSQTTGY